MGGGLGGGGSCAVARVGKWERWGEEGLGLGKGGKVKKGVGGQGGEMVRVGWNGHGLT